MAAGVELGTAYLSLVAETKGLAPSVRRAMGGVEKEAENSGRRSGFGWAKTAGKVLGGAAVAGAGLLAGTAITKGFNRALQLQDAEAKLSGLGHSGKGVAKIMENALGAVKGTAFGMGEAATVAASLVAANVKPGKELEGTLRLVGDAATIAGTDMTSMGAIFGKVAASNKVQMDSINQLHDAGVPALSLLADELGVTAEEASKMASKGEIDFATFQRAMEAGLGGAALKSGETFRGSLANMGAALGRLGVAFANPIVEHAPKLFTAITGAIDSLGESEAFQTVSKKFSDWLVPVLEGAADLISKVDFDKMFASMKSGLGPLTQLAAAFSPIGVILKAMAPVMPQIGDSLARIGAAIGDVLAKVLPAVADAFARVGAALAGALSKALPSLVPLFNALAAVLPKIAPALTLLVGLVATLAVAAINLVTPLLDNEKVVAALVIGFLAWKGTILASKAAMVGMAVATKTWTAITKAAAIAQRALNLVMRANPIGLIITAITALVAGLVWFFTKTKAGKKIIEVVWGAIKKAMKSVADWWTETAWPAIKKAIVAMQIGFKVAKDKISDAWNKIKAGVKVVWEWIRDKVFKPIAVTLLKMRVNFITAKNKVVNAWNAMKAGIKAGWQWIRDKVFSIIKTRLENLRSNFVTAKDKITGAWTTIRNKLGDGWHWIRDNVFSKLKAGVGRVKDAFVNVKDGIKKAWDKLKQIAAKPVNFILGTVYNDGIRKWWNKISGAVGLDSLSLPRASMVKFANGSEDHRAQIAPAGAMRLWAEPETGGEAYIPLAQSKRGRSTAILADVANRFGYGLTQYADGGFWDAVGGAWSKTWRGAASIGKNIWNAGKMATEIVKDPVGAIKKAIGMLAERAGAGGNSGDLFRIVGQLPGKFADGLGKKVKSLFDSGQGKGAAGAAGGGVGGSGLTGKLSAMAASAKALDPTVRVTSGARPGARTVTGYVSYHSRGRAIDMVSSNMGALWDKLYAAYGKSSPELFYSGRSFSRFGVKGAPRSDHWDHVHWAMANGGILPKLYDQGGWLPTGTSLVQNKTGRPEPVFTGDQFDQLTASGGSPLVGTLVVQDERTAIRELEALKRRQMTRHRLTGVRR